jgi:hypothetical protein
MGISRLGNTLEIDMTQTPDEVLLAPNGGLPTANYPKADLVKFIRATPAREAADDLLDGHEENARVLGYLASELQGLIPAGKLAALDQCHARSLAAIAKARGQS